MNIKTLAQNELNELRGPVEHSIRDQILLAADRHFSYYGYGKTTVSDLAKAIGFSKAYIYKFFPSKQAIGEAICHQCLETVLSKVRDALRDDAPATRQLHLLYNTIAIASSELFFHERRLYDIVIYSTGEAWPSSRAYESQVREILNNILQRGRDAGEFERETSLEEQCRAVFLAMESFVNPLLLQYKLDGMTADIEDLLRLVTRSLTAQSDH